MSRARTDARPASLRPSLAWIGRLARRLPARPPFEDPGAIVLAIDPGRDAIRACIALAEEIAWAFQTPDGRLPCVACIPLARADLRRAVARRVPVIAARARGPLSMGLRLDVLLAARGGTVVALIEDEPGRADALRPAGRLLGVRVERCLL